MSLAVQMRGIDKSFGTVKALDHVDLDVEHGAIHALVGENGAGKTTLMRVLYGATQPKAGEIRLDGEPVTFSNSAQAIKAGIGMVSQHYSIIPDLSNLQNLMLGAEPGWLVDRRKSETRAQQLATKMGFRFDWNAPAADLSPAGAQKLEILKLLWRNASIMILDEPTAMLSPTDSDALFASLKQLTAEGATVILVTHRLKEVISHCSYATVLRNGKLAGGKPVSETNEAELGEMIVGHALGASKSFEVKGEQRVRLELKGVSVKGYRGDLALDHTDLSIREGELLGIAGVDGNGQRELFQILTGELKPESGALEWEGNSLAAKSIADRLTLGFRLIPEDRHNEGVINGWSLEENAALGLQRFAPFAKGATIDASGRKQAAGAIAETFNTKHGGLNLPMASLSGGNQQRFVAGRALYLSPKLILAFQPARGLDIDATRNLYEALRNKCKEGASVLVVSFDLDEILENCDEIVVIYAGKISRPPSGKERDRQAIGLLMAGAA